MSTPQCIRSLREQLPHLFNPQSTGCPVDWRWQRAQWRVSSRSRFRERTDDEWVRRALKYQRCSVRRQTDFHPDIAQAERLISTDPWKRAELEARILAGQPIGEIAPALRESEDVLEAFENLFFDVRRRLSAQDWVICSQFGPSFFEQFQPLDVTYAWRSLGFEYGPTIVDVLVKGADYDDLEKFGLPAYWSERSRLPKEFQLLLLSRTIPDQGAKALIWHNRFEVLGLCKELTSSSRPPKDLSLDMASEYLWSEMESQTRVEAAERAEVGKAA